MTIVKKEDREKMVKAISPLMDVLAGHYTTSFDTEALQLLYNTEAEITELEEFSKKWDLGTDYRPPVARVVVCFSSPLVPEPIETEMLFNYIRFGGKVVRWPRGQLYPRDGADWDVQNQLRETLSDYVQGQHDMQVYKSVLHFIIRLNTYEQQRYLFPPILRLWREAGLDHMANKLMTVSKAPACPPLSDRRRRHIRHAIQWATAQELLDRFQHGGPATSRKSSGICLAAGLEASYTGHNGEPVEVRVDRNYD